MNFVLRGKNIGRPPQLRARNGSARQDKTLLRGKIWVDSSTYLLRRTEGEPGKAPILVARESRIVLVYGDVEGMWLQISSESTADVRFVGRHTMLSRTYSTKPGRW